MYIVPRSYKKRKKNYSKLNGWFSDTKPLSPYPQTYSDLPSDMDDWGCDQFRLYYVRNKNIMGKAKALELIINEYDNLSSLSTIYNWCKYDCELVDFFKAEGAPVSTNLIAQAYCASSNVVGAVGSVTESIGNVADTFSSLTSSKFLVVAGLGAAAYLYIKHKDEQKGKK